MGRISSGFGIMVCPLCAVGWLQSGVGYARCGSCGRHVGDDVLRTLEQIAALPEVLGKHACGCGHPEMRLLPDGVCHCPACGSEVTPHGAAPGLGARVGGGGAKKRPA